MENTVFFRAKKLMEIWYLLITENFLFLTFQRWEIRFFFGAKSWWKGDIYWLLKSSCFELFGDGKYGLFLSQKVRGKMIFTDYWKVLVFNFSVMGNTVFFLPKRSWKDVFTWSFWAFHGIPRLGKYCSSCSELSYQYQPGLV